jgi:hypothetical protein
MTNAIKVLLQMPSGFLHIVSTLKFNQVSKNVMTEEDIM